MPTTHTRSVDGLKVTAVAILACWVLTGTGSIASDIERRTDASRLVTAETFECGWRPPEEFVKDIEEAVAKGEIENPALKSIPQIAPRLEVGQVSIGPLTNDDLFLYEDTQDILQTNYSDGQRNALMVAASNALMAEHGDQWDFIAFFLSFEPQHQFGAAFYQGVENNVSGIGVGSYNSRSSIGLGGNNVEGFVMMWNIIGWAEGSGTSANYTRLVLGQEFEHRWGLFLNSIVGGRSLQGDDLSCGRSGHWHFSVDGQGSGMEISEWINLSPATKLLGPLRFNADIGGVWSYPDLYLMGYVSPAEMDSGASQLRYVDGHCSGSSADPIFSFSSADIIATNGPRLPDWQNSQKNYKAAWIMIHPHNDPPVQGQIDRALGIMEQQQIDWNMSTLGRGTLDNSIVYGQFTTSPREGEAPLPVTFTYDSPFAATAWQWDFGDGDMSSAQNPVHEYGPGIYDVEMTATIGVGDRYTIKRSHVTVWADTVEANDLTVPPDTGSFAIDIMATNTLPVKEFILPVSLTNVPTVVSFDSLSKVGCRTDYFEQNTIIFNNQFFGQLAVVMRSDNGGGSPPLPPGTGPIAKVWVTTKPAATTGDTIAVSFGPAGPETLESTTLTTTYNPAWNSAVITLQSGDCACNCHGDPANCEGLVDVFDVVAGVDVAFRSGPEIPDTNPTCPYNTTDVNCDDVTDVFDVIGLVDVAFRSADPAVTFCNPCP